MTAITYATLVADSERAYAECLELAANVGARGAPQARKAIKSARKHGLHDRAYRVRDGMLYGWSGSVGHYTIEPRRGVSIPTSAAQRVAASRARSGSVPLKLICTPEQSAAIEALAERFGVSRTAAVHRAVAEALQSSSNG